MIPFFMAWGMFWIVPCPVKKWDGAYFRQMLLFMPAIGLLIGLVWMLIGMGMGCLCIPMHRNIFGAVLMLVPWCMSGFIHLDGFMDCSDAVLSRRDRAERLRILKDSRCGAFAVIMMCILTVLSFGVFSELELSGRYWILLMIPAVSRACSSWAILYLRPLDSSSYRQMHEAGIPPLCRMAATLEVVGLVILALLISVFTDGSAGLACLAEAAVFALVTYGLSRNLGGMSGDISGCAITVSELAAAAVVLML